MGPADYFESMQKAVRAGMKIVRRCQVEGREGAAEVKDTDATLLTTVDRESGQAMRNLLHELHPNVPTSIEDVGGENISDSFLFLGDPIDGTRAFVNGLTTSTVIQGLYSFETRQVIACVVGEPISGRIWQSFNHVCTLTFESVPDTLRTTSVCKEKFGEQATVIIDVNHGFKRKGRQILCDDSVTSLFKLLTDFPAKILMPGSNGLQQALVANGGERLVGAITTAIGGPWDVCGVHLVLSAGGHAIAYRKDDQRGLVEEDPLDVLNYDLLVVGNNKETTRVLAELLKRVALC